MNKQEKAALIELRKKFGVIWQRVNNNTWETNSVPTIEMTDVSYSKSSVQGKNRIHKETYVSNGDKLYEVATDRELLFLVRKIAPLLKLNNAIVPIPVLSIRDKKRLAQLYKKGVVEKVRGFKFMYVNPEYFRRGSLLTVIGSTYERMNQAESKDCNLHVELRNYNKADRNFMEEDDISAELLTGKS